jgi:hypothetical protein
MIGRDDFHYNIDYSDPDLPGNFIRHNINPLITASPIVRYSVSGLRPLTRYTVRLSVLNGVSEQDPAGEVGRMSEVTATTGDISKCVPFSPLPTQIKKCPRMLYIIVADVLFAPRPQALFYC